MISQVAAARVLRRPGSVRQQGFTLIELMIVVAIIAILSIIAVGSYDWAVKKSRRKAAEGCLLQSAQFMDRWNATNLRYDKDTAGVAITAANVFAGCSTDVTNFYTLAFGAAPTTTTYSVRATPKAGGPQVKDTLCKVLSVDQTGKQTTTGSGTVSDCW